MYQHGTFRFGCNIYRCGNGVEQRRLLGKIRIYWLIQDQQFVLVQPPVLSGQPDGFTTQTGQKPGQRSDILQVEIAGIEALVRNIKSSALSWSPPLIDKIVLLLFKEKKEGLFNNPPLPNFFIFLGLVRNSCFYWTGHLSSRKDRHPDIISMQWSAWKLMNCLQQPDHQIRIAVDPMPWLV